ncbi:MAG TPA: glycosyltransferase family 87 protein [Chitinophagaceae bacterium]|nr:glycosyltransferase family 87 protein [Chitinophagaceae bacterium]
MNSFILSFLAIVTCLCFYLLKRGKNEFKTITWVIYSFVFAIAFYLFISKVIYRIHTPEIWDFTCFYLYGKVAAAGYNFYSPESFHTVFNSLHLPFSDYNDFIPEVVNVGFPYPPPTILYFVPLSFLSYNTALAVWTIFNLFFLFGSIYLVYKLFFKEYQLHGLMLIMILFFILSPVRSTIFYSQTNFIVLFLLLLMKKYSNTRYAGVFLTLAMFTKPYMIVFIMFFILVKNWKAVIYFILSSVVIVGLTIALFGKEPFMSYIFNNSAHRLPAWVFSEGINQSLHAVLLRAHLITIDKPIIYVCISAAFLLATGVYLLFLTKRKLYDYIWVALLLVALMLYPGTLGYYGVLLLFISFQFFDKMKQLGFNSYINIAIIGIFYYLSSFSLFATICFFLFVIILKSFGFFQRIRLIYAEV